MGILPEQAKLMVRILVLSEMEKGINSLECVSGGREAAFMHVRETQGDYLRRLDISG